MMLDDVPPWAMGLGWNAGLAAIARLLPRPVLTPAGLIHAVGLGALLWGCLGPRGYSLMVVYLVAGSAVTSVGLDIKKAKGIAEARDGARGPANLWGAAIGGAVCALGYAIAPAPWWLVGYVGSIATKLADTTASEIGKAYGRTTVSSVTWQPVPPGTEGAVSLEGTLAGLGAAVLVSLLGWGLGLVSSPLAVGICVLAALVATSLESWVGATWQGSIPWLTNEMVNGLNVLTGAAIAVGLAYGLG